LTKGEVQLSGERGGGIHTQKVRGKGETDGWRISKKNQKKNWGNDGEDVWEKGDFLNSEPRRA